METIKKTINYLNPGQTSVDVCDKPVYALKKEIQWRYPDKFGNSSYFCLFGGLDFEQCILTIHGELIKGSGLENISNIGVLIIGTGSVANANHIKQSHYCLQTSLCALFIKLKAAKEKSGSTLSVFEWLELRKNQNDMCYYWYLIFTLQLDIFLYIRSLRESNYKLLVYVMKNLMKWVLLFDRVHYARWGTVHGFDLMSLFSICPDIFLEFAKGHYSFQKSNKKFSKMALDQVHEQKNGKIKGTSGATHLLNKDEGFLFSIYSNSCFLDT